MSYGQPTKPVSQGNRAKKGGGGVLFLLLIVAGAFLLFSKKGELSDETPSENSSENTQVDYGSEEDLGSTNRGKKMPTTGREGAKAGWSMENVNSPIKKNIKSDGWEMEELEGKQKDRTGLQLSNDKDKNAKGQSDWKMEDAGPGNKKSGNKKDENGGWEIEEVDGSKKNDSGVRLSTDKKDNKNQGGWEIEDVKKKKAPKKEGDWELEEVDK